MPEPWFDPNLYAWIPGTVYGMALGALGGLSGFLAPRGSAKVLCLAGWAFFAIVAGIFLVVSVTAFFSSQPYGIWYAFGLPAVQGLILIPIVFPLVLCRYREAEDRKMIATDLTR